MVLELLRERTHDSQRRDGNERRRIRVPESLAIMSRGGPKDSRSG